MNTSRNYFFKMHRHYKLCINEINFFPLNKSLNIICTTNNDKTEIQKEKNFHINFYFFLQKNCHFNLEVYQKTFFHSKENYSSHFLCFSDFSHDQ